MEKYNLKNLTKLSKKLKVEGKKIGLCHGVFDVIHAGHISHFEEVKKNVIFYLSQLLKINLSIKDQIRPVNSHYFRAKILESIKLVDAVGINYTPDAVQSIKNIKPDFYFKGKDYRK